MNMVDAIALHPIDMPVAGALACALRAVKDVNDFASAASRAQ
jgi:hypothetical protein